MYVCADGLMMMMMMMKVLGMDDICRRGSCVIYLVV